MTSSFTVGQISDTYFKKNGRKYEPVCFEAFDRDVFPYNASTLIVRHDSSTYYRYNIEPDAAQYVAGGLVLREMVADILVEMNKLYDKDHDALTPEQLEAYENFNKALNRTTYMYGKSIYEISDEICKKVTNVMIEKHKNPAVREAYEHYLMMVKLSEDNKE